MLGLCCCAWAFSSCGEGGSCNSNYCLLQCPGFSSRRLLLLWTTGSRVHRLRSCGSWALGHRLSSCGARGLVALWHLSGPGIKLHWTVRGVNLIRLFSHRFINDSYLKQLLLSDLPNRLHPTFICWKSMVMKTVYLCHYELLDSYLTPWL